MQPLRLTCADKDEVWLEAACCWLDDLLQHLLHGSMPGTTWQGRQQQCAIEGRRTQQDRRGKFNLNCNTIRLLSCTLSEANVLQLHIHLRKCSPGSGMLIV